MNGAFLAGLAMAGAAVACSGTARAQAAPAVTGAANNPSAADGSTAQPSAGDATCGPKSDPYTNYGCLDASLGAGVFERMANCYKLEWGKGGAPSDPNAPPSRRPSWSPAPQSTPPMPFTEWPYGGTTSLGVTRNSSVDSPLMVGLANAGFGKALTHSGIQIYGWINAGVNVSSNTLRPGGNLPISYAYTPNTIQLDQAVPYIGRLPDTVQTDHVDWGFRLAPI